MSFCIIAPLALDFQGNLMYYWQFQLRPMNFCRSFFRPPNVILDLNFPVVSSSSFGCYNEVAVQKVIILDLQCLQKHLTFLYTHIISDDATEAVQRL